MRDGKKRYLSQTQAACVLLAPFLITYMRDCEGNVLELEQPPS